MTKKRNEDNEEKSESIPLPIQTFLWRQTSPFIRPKFGKQQDALAMEQREACKSFEKVLVQNIQFGLSPSLTDAIKSISRWKLIQASLPHVMHCGSALLYNRKNSNLDKLGAAETKLLYTLHWIVMDAAEECADAEAEQGIIRPIDHYLLPIPTMELFIYLFSPLISYLKHSDFLSSFRLENGYKLWVPLFNYKHPNIPSFTSQVKPKRTIVRASRYEARVQPKFGDVFIGSDGIERKRDTDPVDPTETSPVQSAKIVKSKQDEGESKVTTETYAADVVRGDSVDRVEIKPLADPMMATYLDVATLRCLFTSQWLEEGINWSLNFLINRLKSIQERVNELKTQRPRSSSLPVQSINLFTVYNEVDLKYDSNASYERRLFPEAMNSSNRASSCKDLRRSSFGGISFKWNEPKGDGSCSTSKRFKIRDLIGKTHSDASKQASSDDSPKPPTNSSVRDQSFPAMPYSSPSNFSTSKSPNQRPSKDSLEDEAHPRARPSRSRSAQGMRDEFSLLAIGGTKWSEIKSELIRRTSMPSLHIGDDDSGKLFSPSNAKLEKVLFSSGSKLSPTIKKLSADSGAYQIPANPIITVTEHSPVASAEFFISPEAVESPVLRNDFASNQPQQLPSLFDQRRMFIPPCRQFSITRSQTDSNITYYSEHQTEAPGSVHYITKSGHISALVILKAVHSIAFRDNVCSERVCQGIVNLLNSILSLGFLKHLNSPDPADIFTSSADLSQNTAQRMRFNNSEDLTMFTIFLDTAVKVCRHLGCPHACHGGRASGPQSEGARKTIVEMLNVLYNANDGEFVDYFREMMTHRSIQEIVDTLHAFLGFCDDRNLTSSPHKRSNGLYGHPNYVNNFGAGYSRPSQQSSQKAVESVIIGCIFNPIISRLVKMEKELKSQENMSLYRHVRQFVCYVRDHHGGVFRRVALAGLLESLEYISKLNKQQATNPCKIISPPGAISNMPDQKSDLPSSFTPSPLAVSNILNEDSEKNTSRRKSFFRKKQDGIKKAPSNQSIYEEFLNTNAWPVQGSSINLLSSANNYASTPALLKVNRAASPRLSITEDEMAGQTPTQAKLSDKNEFNLVNWFKNKQPVGSDFVQASDLTIGSGTAFQSALQDNLMVDAQSGDKMSRRPSFQSRTPKIVSAKSSSHVSLTLSKARKRMEDQFKFVFGKSKNKTGSFEGEYSDLKRKDSVGEIEHGLKHDGERIVLREAKLVYMPAIRNGMIKLSFLLESCTPGTFPDPPLVAAILDLKAPVIARAAFFLECAHFVHRCNKGQWPTWMKLNFPVFRASGPSKSGSISCSQGRSTQIFHRNAGRMFYLWAEAIGAHIEELIYNEKNKEAVSTGKENNGTNGNDESNKKKGYRSDDDREDFLDEATINPTGNECPFPLKIAACHLLFEITAFLRETHQYLPTRASKSSIRGIQEKPSHEPKAMTANRRWSMALSSLGFSQTSAHSLMSLADNQNTSQVAQVGERRISFVLHEADAEYNSEHSSNTTDTGRNEEAHTAIEELRRATKRVSQSNATSGRAHLLRRATGSTSSPHNGSFKRRSIKLKKNQDRRTRHRTSSVALVEDNEDGLDHLMKRADSLRSRRKVSGISEKSDTSERAEISGEESPGALSDDGQTADSKDILNADDAEIIRNMPWLRVVINLMNTLDYECPHKYFCSSNCYRRQMKSCSRLVKVIKKVYEERSEAEIVETIAKLMEDKEDPTKKEKKFKKIITGPSSPLRRKMSSGGNIDRYIEKDGHKSHSLHSSTGYLSHYDVEIGSLSLTELAGKKLYGPAGSNAVFQKLDPTPSQKFIESQVKSLFSSPISSLVKGFFNLGLSSINSLLNLSWKLILEPDQNLSSSCSTAFIICSVRIPEQASKLLNEELTHEDPQNRIKAINKFYAIWKSRYQCWQKMEEGAHASFRVPPSMVEFTLPSPKIALPNQPVVDPPWMPPTRSKVEEVTLGQDQLLRKSFVTATKTRRKQQIELVNKALQDEEAKVREERENYRISALNITNEAAYEPALFKTDEPEEGDDDLLVEKPATHHKSVAQAIFPSCLCSAAITIINLLDDPQVSSTGSAIYEVAYKVVWHCLVEDTALFLRNFFEELTRENHQTIFQILRRLIRFMPRLPAQAAFHLYNYLIGFIMFYVRSPTENSQELISTTLSVLWLVIPSVHGLFLKDLKQIFRKEQCDATLLITANVPSAKKVIVHSNDAAVIPSQFPINEDTQFYQVLVDTLETWNIDQSQINEYFLADTKTNQMHNLNAFVRDFYFFKRSQYPQLSLLRLDSAEGYLKLQQQAFKLQFLELGKVLMTLSIIKSQYLAIQRVLFLHDELMKLPTFPRKALEANFSLHRGPMGKEILGMDTLHKIVWVKLVGRMMEVTQGFFVQSSDIYLFLNVVSGSLVLHSEDAAMIRLSMATFLNAAHQFKNIFSANGYLMIMPTILRIYSNHQTNGLLCRTIEFVCKQFYIMHRKPFILQMFGSAASILDVDSVNAIGDASRIQPKAFFQLLQSLGQYIVDPLDILELVDAEKPLKALDFCYQMDPEALTILDAISLCVTVAAYAPDSQRGHQMLTILETILPLFIKHMQTLTMKKETPGGSKTELQMIHNVSVCIKTLIRNSEALNRNFAGPQRAIDLRGSSMKNTSRSAYSPPIDIDEDSHSKFMGETYFPTTKSQKHGDGDAETIRSEFRKPRDILLNLVSEFLSKSTARLADLSKKVPDLHQKNSSFELLDVKCHLRLAEIAHSLLKIAPYDPPTMACRGLVRYMNEVLPNSEWRQEAMRPALIMILRRLDKMFNKIAKQGVIKRLTDWDAAKRLLKGVYSTFVKHPYIVHLPHLKSLINVCQGIILGDSSGSLTGDNVQAQASWAAVLAQSPPPGFCSVAVRLIAMQLLHSGDTQTLETLCGNAFTSPEKSEIYLLNMIHPMCIRISGGLSAQPKLRSCDTSFILSVILSSLNPPQTKTGKLSESSVGLFQSSLQQIGLLGLKIMMVCFERQLSNDWYRIAKCVRENSDKNLKGVTFWNFIDFVVTYRTPLFIMLLPLIRYKLLQKICENDQEYFYQQLIRCKLEGQNMPPCRSRGQLLVCLFAELRGLKDDLISQKIGHEEKRKSYGIGHRLSFTVSAFQSGLSRHEKSSTSQVASEEPSDGTGEHAPPKRPSLLRTLSFRVDRVSLNRGTSVKMSEELRKSSSGYVRRTSYPSGGEEKPPEGKKGTDPQTQSEPKLFRKPTAEMRRQAGQKNASKLQKDIKEENSKMLSPSQDAESFDGDDDKPRLQRQKAQSRKTFRFRKSRKGNESKPSHGESSPLQSSLSLSPPENKEIENNTTASDAAKKTQSDEPKNCNTQEPSDNSALLGRLFSIKTDTLPV